MTKLSAVALSVKPGGSAEGLDIAGGLTTHGSGIECIELHGQIGRCVSRVRSALSVEASRPSDPTLNARWVDRRERIKAAAGQGDDARRLLGGIDMRIAPDPRRFMAEGRVAVALFPAGWRRLVPHVLLTSGMMSPNDNRRF